VVGGVIGLPVVVVVIQAPRRSGAVACSPPS